MRSKLSVTIALSLLVLTGCNTIPDSDSFATQVAQEINSTQTAQVESGGTTPASIYTPIRADNASQLEVLKTFTGDPVTNLVAAAGADVLAYVSVSGIHLLNPASLSETGFIAVPAWIHNIAISPDGRFIAAGDEEGNIHIWSTSDHSLKGTIAGVWVNKLAFSPDGRTLIGIDWDGVYGWQVPDGRSKFTTKGMEDFQGFSIDGAETFGLIPGTSQVLFPHHYYIADESGKTTRDDLTWYSVDLSTGTLEESGWVGKTGKSGEGDISDIAFSPNDSFFIVAWENYPVELWKLENGRPALAYTFPDQTKDAHQVSFSLDGKNLGIVTRGGSIQLWDVTKREMLHEWTGSSLAILNRDGQVALMNESEIQLMDISTGETVTALSYAAIQTVAISQNGNLIVLGMNNGRLEVWSQRGQTLTQTLDSGMKNIAYMYFDPQGQHFIANSTDGKSVIWRSSTWERLPFPNGADHPAFWKDTSLFVTRALDPNQLFIWGDKLDAPRFILKHPADVLGFCLSPAEPIVAAHIADGTVWFWDLNTGSFLRSLDDYLDWGIDSFSSDGKVFTSLGEGQTIKIWSVEAASLLYSQKFNFPIEYVSMNPTGDAMLVADWDGGVTYLWRFGNPALEQYPGYFDDLLPSGDLFATETYREIKIWRISDGSEFKTYSISGSLLGFSGDSSLMYIQRYPDQYNGNTYLQVLAVNTGETLVSLDVDGYFSWLGFSGDNSTLTGLSNKGIVYIWGIAE